MKLPYIPEVHLGSLAERETRDGAPEYGFVFCTCGGSFVSSCNVHSTAQHTARIYCALCGCMPSCLSRTHGCLGSRVSVVTSGHGERCGGVQTPRAPPAPVAALLSPILWRLNTPDRFDMYSVGVMMLQMVMPALRSDSALITFRRKLERFNFDMRAWRRDQVRHRLGFVLACDGITQPPDPWWKSATEPTLLRKV